MRRVSLFLMVIFFPFAAFAGDVYVNGYYNQDGTYVAPHYRSAPDGRKSNNYGPLGSGQNPVLTPPAMRDYDRDGMSNRFDTDSDNDGVPNQIDRNPYSRKDDNFQFPSYQNKLR